MTIDPNFNTNNNHNSREKINILFSLFFLNIIYIILELPLPIISFIALLQGDLYFYFLFLGYLGYAINSIIIVTTNSLFRKEFFS